MARLALVTVLGMATLVGCDRRATPISPAAATPTANIQDLLLASAVGSYALTFTAASACHDIPPSLRTRHYTATVRREGGHLEAELGGATFYPRYDSFFLQFSRPDTVTFYLYSSYFALQLEDYPIVERLAPGGFLSIAGTANVPFNESVPAESNPFEGEFGYCAVPIDRGDSDGNMPGCAKSIFCKSLSNHLTVVRR
jgi:hypothetical protein